MEDSPAKPKRNGNVHQAPLDTDSETAFPSLAPSAPTQARQTNAAWRPAIRSQPAVAMQNLATDSFTVSVIDLSSAGKDGKPTTLGEIMKQVMVKHSKVKVEGSSNQKTRQTTFHLKSESAKELEKARKMLVAMISPQVMSILCLG